MSHHLNQLLNELATGDVSPAAAIITNPKAAELTPAAQSGETVQSPSSVSSQSITDLARKVEERHAAPKPAGEPTGFFAQVRKASNKNAQADPREADRLDRPKTLLSIEKPTKNDFIRTKLQGYEAAPTFTMIEAKMEGDKFGKLMWLDPAIDYPSEVVERAVEVNLVLCATHQRKFFLYPIKQTGDTDAEWYTTACVALADAEKEWLQMRWDGKGFRTLTPRTEPEPVDWSKVGEAEQVVQDSLRAVRLTVDHPFVRSLFGETLTKEDKPSSFLARFKKS